ncbi:MAG: hydrogenase maturation nickel metallochaperone HypA [Clostridiales bacterium]|jgi:hypothetical protein|nr:hydrogenase maturation nickel metallochaperone HypA [Clostridiales bacterium]
MTTEVIRCRSCGSPLDPKTMKCEHCGSYNVVVDVNGDSFQFCSKYKLDLNINLKDLIAEMCRPDNRGGAIPAVFAGRETLFGERGGIVYAVYDLQTNKFAPMFDLNRENDRLKRAEWFLLEDKIHFLNEYFEKMNVYLNENNDRNEEYDDRIEVLHMSVGYEQAKRKDFLEGKLKGLSYYGASGTFAVNDENIANLKTLVKSPADYYAGIKSLKHGETLTFPYWNELFTGEGEPPSIDKNDAVTFSMTNAQRALHTALMTPIKLLAFIFRFANTCWLWGRGTVIWRPYSFTPLCSCPGSYSITGRTKIRSIFGAPSWRQS